MTAVRAGLADRNAGPARRERLADLVDTALCRLWEHAGGPQQGVALVAVGSHARRDGGPASDLDLVLVHDERAMSASELTALADRLWYPLWDNGIRLDHAVRSVAGCKAVAADDLAAAIGMLDVRGIAGDASLALRTREVLRSQWRRDARGRLDELAESLQQRSRSHGELAYLLEPDLKESRGGLRDAVALQALVASWLTDVSHHEGVGEAAQRLLDVRDALHAMTGRTSERLVMAEQDGVAAALGLPDADALLAEVCGNARVISYHLDLTLRRARGAAARRRGLRRRRPSLRLLEPGLVEHEGEVCLSAAAPADDPTLAVRAAAAAAWHRLPLSPVTARHLAERATPDDQGEVGEGWSVHSREALLRLLGAGEPLVGVWETLDQAGLVTRWLPEWQTVRNRPQRNAVHRHTVDRHSVQTCVEASALLDRVARPDLLLLAALLHDIGKRPGATDHSQVGAPIAGRVALRLGFDSDQADLVARLVREHLTLVELATRRDPDDPATVAALLAAVDHRTDVLALLRALTEADARATGGPAWTPWRARLVDDLTVRARAALAGEPAPGPSPLTATENDLVVAARADGQPRVEITPMDGFEAVTFVAPDRRGLFADVAGLLAAHGLNVRSALVRTVDGMAVDTWSVQGARQVEATVLRTGLLRLGAGDVGALDRLARREASWRPGRSAEPGGAGPRVMVVPDASLDATVLEVRAVDRPGLLYALGCTVRDLGVDVRSAHVATHAGRAVDVLYLSDIVDGVPHRLSAGRTGALVGALMAAACWEPS